MTALLRKAANVLPDGKPLGQSRLRLENSWLGGNQAVAAKHDKGG